MYSSLHHGTPTGFNTCPKLSSRPSASKRIHVSEQRMYNDTVSNINRQGCCAHLRVDAWFTHSGDQWRGGGDGEDGLTCCWPDADDGAVRVGLRRLRTTERHNGTQQR